MELKQSLKILEAIPSMCVLVVKNDKDAKPLRAKSCTVVLGNSKDRIYHKYQQYAPLLKYVSLRILTARAVGDKHIHQQGDCKIQGSYQDVPFFYTPSHLSELKSCK